MNTKTDRMVVSISAGIVFGLAILVLGHCITSNVAEAQSCQVRPQGCPAGQVLSSIGCGNGTQKCVSPGSSVVVGGGTLNPDGGILCPFSINQGGSTVAYVDCNGNVTLPGIGGMGGNESLTNINSALNISGNINFASNAGATPASGAGIYLNGNGLNVQCNNSGCFVMADGGTHLTGGGQFSSDGTGVFTGSVQTGAFAGVGIITAGQFQTSYTGPYEFEFQGGVAGFSTNNNPAVPYVFNGDSGVNFLGGGRLFNDGPVSLNNGNFQQTTNGFSFNTGGGFGNTTMSFTTAGPVYERGMAEADGGFSSNGGNWGCGPSSCTWEYGAAGNITTSSDGGTTFNNSTLFMLNGQVANTTLTLSNFSCAKLPQASQLQNGTMTTGGTIGVGAGNFNVLFYDSTANIKLMACQTACTASAGTITACTNWDGGVINPAPIPANDVVCWAGNLLCGTSNPDDSFTAVMSR